MELGSAEDPRWAAGSALLVIDSRSRASGRLPGTKLLRKTARGAGANKPPNYFSHRFLAEEVTVIIFTSQRILRLQMS